jgi:predicted ATPase
MRGIVGRRREREAVEAAFAAGHRVVTLLGAPGVGKTWLALALAEGEPVCDLSQVGSIEEAERVVGRVGLDGCRRVVLDDVDQLLPGFLERVLAWSGRAPLLVTSRTRLCLSDEAVVALAPLEVPARDADDATIMASEAVVLLGRAARAAGLERELSPQELGEIARAVDGLPLALALAATRIRALGGARLIEELREPLRALTRAPRDAPAHHASLERAIDRSWQLLSHD